MPDDVYENVKRLAALTGHEAEEIFASAVASFVGDLSPQIDPSIPIDTLSDEDVIALAELQMNPKQDTRLSDLLYKQQADDLTDTERTELQMLMRIYEQGTLRKSEALAEAVRRGLREPLEP